MKKHQFIERVKKLERHHAADPKTGRLRVLSWLSLGYVGLILVCSLPALTLALLALVLIRFHLWIWAVPVLGLVWGYLRHILPSLTRSLHTPEHKHHRRVMPGEAPALFELIESVRKKLKGPRLHALFISDEMNASITQYPGWMLIGRTRHHMVLGLPLLQTLSTQQVAAVIAHEYGHLRGADGALSARTYAMRCAWLRVEEAFNSRASWATLGLRAFLHWYVPRFNAETFVQGRACEYAADETSAMLVGKEQTIQVLYAVRLAGRYLRTVFWPDIYAAALHGESSRAYPYTLLAAGIPSSRLGQIEATAWLHEELCSITDYDDTHPCLADRVRHLGADLTQLPIAPLFAQQTAAQQLLGDLHANYVTELEHRWREDGEQDWVHARQQWQQIESDYHSLLRRQATQALQAHDYLKIAILQRRLKIAGWEDSLHRSLEQQADYADALFEEGIRKLNEQSKQQAIDLEELNAAQSLFNQAMDNDADEIYRCSRALTRVELLRNDPAAAAQHRQRADQALARRRELDVEVSHVGLNDTFAPHELSSYALSKLNKTLKPLLKCARAVWLAKKVPQLDSRRVHYVLVVHASDPPLKKMLNRLRLQGDQRLNECYQLARKFDLELPLSYVWHFAESDDPLLSRVDKDFHLLQ